MFIGLFDEGVVHWPTLFSIVILPMIVIAYFLLSRIEEKKVLEQFGDQYRYYQKQVPMFIPHLEQWKNFVHRQKK